MSTPPVHGKATASGTSMAAPHVAGIAALYLAVTPIRGRGSEVGDGSGSTLKMTVNGLNGGTTYYATVQAVNAVGPSSWSPRSNTATAKR